MRIAGVIQSSELVNSLALSCSRLGATETAHVVPRSQLNYLIFEFLQIFRSVSGVNHQLGCRNNPSEVIGRMIRKNNRATLALDGGRALARPISKCYHSFLNWQRTDRYMTG